VKSRSKTKSASERGLPLPLPLPLLNGAGKPPLPLEQIIKKWVGVFEPEFWDEVENARKPAVRRGAAAHATASPRP
jgi:hypothetical protein